MTKYRKIARPMGRIVISVPDAEAWAVRVLISPLMRMRSRIVCAMLSRISARLPPTVRWMATAVTTRSKSGLSMRFNMLLSASSTDPPRFISRTARENSSDIGGTAFLATVSTACAKE